MLRVFPYGALQFVSYEQYKKVSNCDHILIHFIVRSLFLPFFGFSCGKAPTPPPPPPFSPPLPHSPCRTPNWGLGVGKTLCLIAVCEC